jgi:hypothetical protein
MELFKVQNVKGIRKNLEVKLMIKRKKARTVISILVILALTFGTIAILLTGKSGNVKALDFRGGFSLVPVNSDIYGIKVNTEFELVSENDYSLEEIKSMFSIDNQENPEILETGKNKFRIILKNPLKTNSLYTFRMEIGDDEIKWVFQTERDFKVAGVFPANESSGVPVDSGIEIYFSYEGYNQPEKFFEISPGVKGKFEVHKQALVFVPDKLSPGTLYEVKIKKGLKLTGSEKALEKDYVFKFETQNEDEHINNRNKSGYFAYSGTLSEYRSDEKPLLDLYYGVNTTEENTISVNTKIYKYSNIDTFITALNKKMEIPDWAYINSQKNKISTKGLNEILSFTQDLPVKIDYDAAPPAIQVPSVLEKGFYLVDSYWKETQFQTFIQVTDLGTYSMHTEKEMLVWLNNLVNKSPVSDASISYTDNSVTVRTDENGIGRIKVPDDEDNSTIILKIEKGNDSAVLMYNTAWLYRYGSDGENYWKFNTLDRRIYKPSDTINFWGFIKNRYNDEDIKNLTVEITTGGFYGRPISDMGYKGGYFPFNSNTILKKEIKVSGNVYSDNLWLENIGEGNYQLLIRYKDKTIVNDYFTVENYKKPAYKIEIEKSKNAIFNNEEIVFDINSLFFEGTPVAGLKFKYYINGYGIKNENGEGQTNQNGKAQIKFSPELDGENNQIIYATINVYASLPEIGEIYKQESVKVFRYNINVDTSGKKTDNKAVLNFKLNNIDLAGLNSKEANYSTSYLGNPVSGRQISGTVYKNTWVKTQTGNTYDFINKKSVPKYDYSTRKEAFKTFILNTDKNGTALFEFDTEEFGSEGGYYTYEYTTSDNSGKIIREEIRYIGIDYPVSPEYSENERYILNADKEKYLINDDFSVSFQKGENEMPDGSYLFIEAQNGIKSVNIKNSPVMSGTFSEDYMPGIGIYGIYFDGTKYIVADNARLSYDFLEKELTLEAKPDKDSYKPGDEVKMNISVKDKNGNPISANVNLSLVDEAVFALRDQSINTLESLYSFISDGILQTNISHKSNQQNNLQISARGGMGGSVVMEKSIAFGDEGAFDTTPDIREDFRDTALFITIKTDETGTGNAVFILPDNITSWRVTMSAVNNELYAGSDVSDVKVSMPMFINYSLASTFINGDIPVLDVSAYGDSLFENSVVIYKVYKNDEKSPRATYTGKAFTRSSIQLWPFQNDMDSITVTAETPNGLSDGIKHPVKVISTYHELIRTVTENVVKDMTIKGGTKDNTKLLFTGGESGELYNMLYRNLWNNGNRLDQVLPAKSAQDILKEKIEDFDIDSRIDFKLSDYQNEDGGFGILPYAESDAELTVNMLMLIKNGYDKNRIRNYLYSKMGESTASDAILLYGLSLLKEPVLIDLDRLYAIENMSVKGNIYLALAYYSIGEEATALRIYNEKIYPETIKNENYNYVDTGVDNDENLLLTSKLAILTSLLNDKDYKSYFNYIGENSGKDVLVRMEKAIYISLLKDKILPENIIIKASFMGKDYEIDVSNGKTYYMEIPSSQLSKFKINEVTGSAKVISTFTSPKAESVKNSDNLSVSRKYVTLENAAINLFNIKSGDIIKVELSWKIDKNAPSGEYEISDYLPSGLTAIDNTWKYRRESGDSLYYKKINGQKVSFYVYNSNDLKDQSDKITYYARVISRGIYTADGTIIQKTNANDILNISSILKVQIN